MVSKAASYTISVWTPSCYVYGLDIYIKDLILVVLSFYFLSPVSTVIPFEFFLKNTACCFSAMKLILSYG